MNRRFWQIKEAGFTFLELMYVVILITILVTMATLNFSSLQNDTTEELVRVDLKVLRAAARAYYLKNGTFPPDLKTLVSDGYLDELPHDKFVRGGGADYLFVSGATTYTIWSRGPDGQDDNRLDDDVWIQFSP